MSDYLTLAEALAIHDHQIERYGGFLTCGITAFSKPPSIDRRQATTPT